LRKDYLGDHFSNIYRFDEIGGAPEKIGGLIVDQFSPGGLFMRWFCLAQTEAEKEFWKNVSDAKAFTVAARKEAPREGIDIFGYSRGAVAAIELAQQLYQEEIPVRFLGLLEPSATWSGVDKGNLSVRFSIPMNVAVVWLGYGIGKDKGVNWLKDLPVTHFYPMLDNDLTTRQILKYDRRVGHLGAGRSAVLKKSLYESAIAAGVPLKALK
jgi:hypothetical protein